MLHLIRELYAFQQAVRFPAALFQKVPEVSDDHFVDDPGLILREATLLSNRPEHLPAAVFDAALAQHVEDIAADVLQLIREELVITLNDLGEGDGMSAEEDMLERTGICKSVPAEDLPGMEKGIFRGLHLYIWSVPLLPQNSLIVNKWCKFFNKLCCGENTITNFL